MFNYSKTFSYISCLLVICVWSFQSQADEKNIYKKTDDKGVVEFTDVPDNNTKPIRVPPMNTYKQKKLPSIKSKPLPAEVKEGYTELSITSPLHDKIMRENSGKIVVKLEITPSLKTEHKIIVSIDGDSKTAIKGTSSSVTFDNISRGTHTVQASIIDSQDKVIIKAEATTFHLRRFFVPPKPTIAPAPAPTPPQ